MKDVRLREADHSQHATTGYELSRVCAYAGCTRFTKRGRGGHKYCKMHRKRLERERARCRSSGD